MCSAHPLMEFNSVVKFHEIILNSIKVMEWTQSNEPLMDRRMDGQSDGWTLKILDGIT